MKTTAYRALDKLNPAFRSKVEKFMEEVNRGTAIIFITESWRSEERQAELLKAGLSQVRHSNHQDGLAIDIGFLGAQLYPSDLSKWRKVADIGKKYGIDWGFDLWAWDKPHFQDNGKILSIINPTMAKSKYSDIMTQVCKDANFQPLFADHTGDKPLTEQETKELIEIAMARYSQRKK